MARIKYKEAVRLEVKRGRPTTSRKPGKAELKRLYVKESRSIREAAEILGCSKDMVYESLKEYRIERRPGFARSRLRSYDLSYLRRETRKRSYKELANELGIHENTLRHYLKREREKEKKQ